MARRTIPRRGRIPNRFGRNRNIQNINQPPSAPNARQRGSSPPDDWTRWMEENQPSNWMPQICFGYGVVYCRDLFPFGRRLRGMF